MAETEVPESALDDIAEKFGVDPANLKAMIEVNGLEKTKETLASMAYAQVLGGTLKHDSDKEDKSEEKKPKGLGVGVWVAGLALSAVAALYMGSAFSRHAGYRASEAQDGPRPVYTIKDNEVHFINGRVIKVDDPKTMTALEKKIQEELKWAPKDGTHFDKADYVLEGIQDIAGDDYVAGHEVPGGYSFTPID